MNLQTRLCEQKDCTLPATFALLWRGHLLYLCGFHAYQMVGTAEQFGETKPRETLRPLEPHERVGQPAERGLPPILLGKPVILGEFFEDGTFIPGDIHGED